MTNTKISVEIPTDDLKKLDSIAEKSGISTADAVRQAIALEVILMGAKNRGAKILIEEPNKSTKIINF